MKTSASVAKNKYRRWHDSIIARACSRGPFTRAEYRSLREVGICFEDHHITPRLLGGEDTASNIVELTQREHWLVHWLLTKFMTGDARRAMEAAMVAITTRLLGGKQGLARLAYYQRTASARIREARLRRDVVIRAFRSAPDLSKIFQQLMREVKHG